jgi:hypothetical protein
MVHREGANLMSESIGSAICAVPGCRRIVSPKHLMCMPHWSRVPEDLQQAVHRTHAAFTEASAAAARGPGRLVTGDQAHAMGAARGAYLMARAAAVQSVIDQAPPGAALKTRELK